MPLNKLFNCVKSHLHIVILTCTWTWLRTRHFADVLPGRVIDSRYCNEDVQKLQTINWPRMGGGERKAKAGLRVKPWFICVTWTYRKLCYCWFSTFSVLFSFQCDRHIVFLWRSSAIIMVNSICVCYNWRNSIDPQREASVNVKINVVNLF